MSKTTPEQNKAIVLEAFDTLFNKRDYAAAERFWSPKYIQHSAHIAPGREGLFALVRSTPDTLRYENQLIVAEGDYVIAHGRFTGMGRPAAWIAADIVRFEDGLLAEHWDVLRSPLHPRSRSCWTSRMALQTGLRSAAHHELASATRVQENALQNMPPVRSAISACSRCTSAVVVA